MSLETVVVVAVCIVAVAALFGWSAKFRNNLIVDAIAKTAEILRAVYAERGTEGVLREIREGSWITNYRDARNENSKRVYFRSNRLAEFEFYILDVAPNIGPVLCVRGEGAFRGFEASAGLDRPVPKGTAQAHEIFGNPTTRAKALAAAFQRRHGWTPNEALMGWRNGVYVGR